MKPQYDIIFSEQTLKKVQDYHNKLNIGKTKAGENLRYAIEKSKKNLKNITIENFLELLLSTKRPKIFAEREIRGNGKDWNNHELSILGDINVRMPVEIFDNGVWQSDNNGFKAHTKPFKGELLFTPGALLHTCSQFEGPLPDLVEISDKGKINQIAYNKLIERRILPVLVRINEQAKKIQKPALVVMPGIGAGEFSGHYNGKIGESLNIAMQEILKKYAKILTEIDIIHYDPYNECKNQQKNFANIKYRVRPQLNGNLNKTQLNYPKNYQEDGDIFNNHLLFKIVSWDHLSLPGNDFFGGMRFTDNGMAAAATDSMRIITGKKGKYDKNIGKYLPPKGYRFWEEIAVNTPLKIEKNAYIVTDEGIMYNLSKNPTKIASPIKKLSSKTSKSKVSSHRAVKKIIPSIISNNSEILDSNNNENKSTKKAKNKSIKALSSKLKFG